VTYSQAGGSPLKYNLEQTNHVSNSSQSALCATIDYQMTRFDVRLGANRSFSLNGYDYEATEKVSLQPAAPKRVIAFLESETEGSDLVGGIYSDTTEQKMAIHPNMSQFRQTGWGFQHRDALLALASERGMSMSTEINDDLDLYGVSTAQLAEHISQNVSVVFIAVDYVAVDVLISLATMYPQTYFFVCSHIKAGE
jgi:hypothetical protein